MGRVHKRKNKQLSQEEIEEMELFLNRNNVEEEKVFQTISVHIKCKTENQKKLVNSTSISSATLLATDIVATLTQVCIFFFNIYI